MQPEEDGKPRLRIFLSYGRDEYQKFALRLKADLEKLGHEVWFDQERLLPGKVWEEYIEKGLNWASTDRTIGRMILLVTPHSVRRPDGYCLNELSYALERKLEPIPVVVIPAQVPLSLHNRQTLDMTGCYPPEQNEGPYQRQFELLLRALNNGEAVLDKRQADLSQWLKPIQFANDIFEKSSDFQGRHWLFAKVKSWLEDENAPRLFWLLGTPGIGKSAIAAKLCQMFPEISAMHFCDYRSVEKKDPSKLVCSLAFQLSTQIPEYADSLRQMDVKEIIQEYRDKPFDLFDKLIVESFDRNFPKPDRPIVVLIDALDEASCNGRNSIADFLGARMDRLPTWFRFFITSRPEKEVMHPFSGRPQEALRADSEQNMDDLRAYLFQKLPNKLLATNAVVGEIVNTLLKASQGHFFYLKQVLEGVKTGKFDLSRVKEFPIGLDGLYGDQFSRHYPTPLLYQQRARDAMRLLMAARGPLPVSLMLELLHQPDGQHWDRERMADFVSEVGSYLRMDGTISGDLAQTTLSIYHKSFADWLGRDNGSKYYTDAEKGHQAFALHAQREINIDLGNISPYLLHNAVAHAIAGGKLSGELFMNFPFLMARFRMGGLEGLLEDAQVLGRSANDPLAIWCEFFRERAHLLRKALPEWGADRILFQFAIEHADDSPLTVQAEKYLDDGYVTWHWLRDTWREPHAVRTGCVGVMVHEGDVTDAQLLPNGHILSSSSDRKLRLWDGATGLCLHVLQGHTGKVQGAQLLTDGGILSWSSDKTLRIWDVATGICINVLEGHTGKVKGAQPLPDGRILSWSSDKMLRIWDGATGICLHVLEGHKSDVLDALLLPGGRILSWSWNTTLRIWDGATGICLHVLEGHTGLVLGAQFLPGGLILSWSTDTTLRIWDGATGIYLHVLEGHTDIVTGIKLLLDGHILSWSWDSTLRIWDSATGICLHVLEGHTDIVTGIKLLPDGRIMSWSRDTTIRIWDGATGMCIHVLEGHIRSVQGAQLLPDGRIMSWSSDKTLRIWDGATGMCIHVLEGHIRSVQDAQLLPVGHILSWSKDNALRIWDVTSRTSKSSVKGHSNTVKGARILPDGHIQLMPDGRILSWSWDNALRIWDGATGMCLHALDGHEGFVSGAQFLPDGRILSWSWDNTLRIWDGATGICLHVLEGHSGDVLGTKLLPDGRILSWCRDTTLRIWDGATGMCLHVLEGHSGDVRGTKLLPDGRILSWSRDKTVRIWDEATGKCLHALEGHIDLVLDPQFLPDGHILLLYWNILTIWDCATGACLHALEGHTDLVLGTQLLPDGHILSWSVDQTLRIWDSATETCLHVLKGHTNNVRNARFLTGKGLLSWSNNEIIFWDIEQGLSLQTFLSWKYFASAYPDLYRMAFQEMYPYAVEEHAITQCLYRSYWLSQNQMFECARLAMPDGRFCFGTSVGRQGVIKILTPWHGDTPQIS